MKNSIEWLQPSPRNNEKNMSAKTDFSCKILFSRLRRYHTEYFHLKFYNFQSKIRKKYLFFARTFGAQARDDFH